MFESRQMQYFMFTTQNSASNVFKFTVRNLKLWDPTKTEWWLCRMKLYSLFQSCSKVKLKSLYFVLDTFPT